MTQHLAVFAIVLVAAVYAAWKLLPAGATRPVVKGLALLARRTGIGGERLARWQARTGSKACGACDACSGCAPATDAATIPIKRR